MYIQIYKNGFGNGHERIKPVFAFLGDFFLLSFYFFWFAAFFGLYNRDIMDPGALNEKCIDQR